MCSGVLGPEVVEVGEGDDLDVAGGERGLVVEGSDETLALVAVTVWVVVEFALGLVVDEEVVAVFGFCAGDEIARLGRAQREDVANDLSRARSLE